MSVASASKGSEDATHDKTAVKIFAITIRFRFKGEHFGIAKTHAVVHGIFPADHPISKSLPRP